jgi:hypothetical protein
MPWPPAPRPDGNAGEPSDAIRIAPFFGSLVDELLLLSPSLPHDLPSLVVGAFKASLAELLLDHLYRLVLADAGRNHNPLLLQLVNQIFRLPL